MVVWCGGVFSPCARTFQGLHSVRLWTPTILRLYNFCKAAGQGCMAMVRVQYAQFGDLPLQLIAEHALFIKVILSNFHKLFQSFLWN
jgi:hypothetical protein